MTRKIRNTEEIVRLAKEKSDRTKANVEKVLSRMSVEGKSINFNSVSKEANVSKSWLYKDDGVRRRIEELRSKQIRSLQGRTTTKKSQRSEEVLIKTLKERIKVLEEENLQLNRQIQNLYGELYSKE